MKIIKQEPKKLLSREEFIAVVEESTTPSHAKIKEDISKKTGKQADLIVIKKIHQEYGKPEVKVTFYVYQNAEALKRFEVEKKTKKVAGAAPAAK